MVTRPTIHSLHIPSRLLPRQWLWLSLLSVLILAACAGPTPTAAPTLAPILIQKNTATPASTVTPFPTETSQPTLTPTITATLPPTPTVTITPDPSMAEVKLIGLAWMMPQYDMLLTFQFPASVKTVDPAKFRAMLEDKEYKCQVLSQYPNRLYCIGQGAKVLTTAWVRLYQAGSDKPGFEKEMWIPYFPKK